MISLENLAKKDEILDAIALDDESVWLILGVKVDNTGNVTYYQYGTDGKVLREEILDSKGKKGNPIIWNKGE